MDKKPNIPDSYFCPLSKQLMVSPMIDPEGNSYEKEAITEYLTTHKKSPITSKSLSIFAETASHSFMQFLQKVFGPTYCIRLSLGINN